MIQISWKNIQKTRQEYGAPKNKKLFSYDYQVVYLKKTPLRQKSSKMKGGSFLAISTKILGSTCVFKSPEAAAEEIPEAPAKETQEPNQGHNPG